MLLSNTCICGFMPNLHKKSWMVSSRYLPCYKQTNDQISEYIFATLFLQTTFLPMHLFVSQFLYCKSFLEGNAMQSRKNLEYKSNFGPSFFTPNLSLMRYLLEKICSTETSTQNCCHLWHAIISSKVSEVTFKKINGCKKFIFHKQCSVQLFPKVANFHPDRQNWNCYKYKIFILPTGLEVHLEDMFWV